jgi:hypothetical protein
MKEFVNLKSELTRLKAGYENLGYTVFRTRTQCGCRGKDNRRDAMVVACCDRIVEIIIRCKACRKEAENGKV